MGLADIVRSGVAIADSLTSDLQKDVTHYLYSEATVDSYGKVTWGSPHTRKAVVEPKRRLVRNAEGHDVLTNTKLTFPRPVLVNPRDRIVMYDGTEAPIVAVSGAVDDSSTGQGYIAEVYL
jgi:hypothetical protein